MSAPSITVRKKLFGKYTVLPLDSEDLKRVLALEPGSSKLFGYDGLEIRGVTLSQLHIEHLAALTHLHPGIQMVRLVDCHHEDKTIKPEEALYQALNGPNMPKRVYRDIFISANTHDQERRCRVRKASLLPEREAGVKLLIGAAIIILLALTLPPAGVGLYFLCSFLVALP
jgi:hypothetical protein